MHVNALQKGLLLIQDDHIPTAHLCCLCHSSFPHSTARWNVWAQHRHLDLSAEQLKFLLVNLCLLRLKVNENVSFFTGWWFQSAWTILTIVYYYSQISSNFNIPSQKGWQNKHMLKATNQSICVAGINPAKPVARQSTWALGFLGFWNTETGSKSMSENEWTNSWYCILHHIAMLFPSTLLIFSIEKPKHGINSWKNLIRNNNASGLASSNFSEYVWPPQKPNSGICSKIRSTSP